MAGFFVKGWRCKGILRTYLQIHPLQTIGKPALHPVDFLFVSICDVPVGPDVGAEYPPFLVISFLGFIEVRCDFANIPDEIFSFKLVSPEIVPAVCVL